MWLTSDDKSQGLAGSPFLVASERINKCDADVMNVSVFSRSSSYVSSRLRSASAHFPLCLMRVIQDSRYPGSAALHGTVRDRPLHPSAGQARTLGAATLLVPMSLIHFSRHGTRKALGRFSTICYHSAGVRLLALGVSVLLSAAVLDTGPDRFRSGSEIECVLFAELCSYFGNPCLCRIF